VDRFAGKVALVTGAGSGIGLASARRLKDEGAIVVAGLFDEGQRQAAAGFDQVLLDVRKEESWQAAIAHARTEHGRLDVLVNAAGVSPSGTAEETDRALWDQVFEVNLWGMFLGCKHALAPMRAAGGGAIVNVASINAIRGNTNMVAYAASKGGVVALTMALALDHVRDHIRVNCICPATVDTAMVQDMLQAHPHAAAARATMIAKHPIGRMAKPEEIAGVIAFLASEDASFMTGLALPVDGGRSIR